MRKGECSFKDNLKIASPNYCYPGVFVTNKRFIYHYGYDLTQRYTSFLPVNLEIWKLVGLNKNVVGELPGGLHGVVQI